MYICLLLFRLKRMIEIVFNVVHKLRFKVAEFSRMFPARQRPRVLRQFGANKIELCVLAAFCVFCAFCFLRDVEYQDLRRMSVDEECPL